jgi:hypothetical protein
LALRQNSEDSGRKIINRAQTTCIEGTGKKKAERIPAQHKHCHISATKFSCQINKRWTKESERKEARTSQRTNKRSCTEPSESKNAREMRHTVTATRKEDGKGVNAQCSIVTAECYVKREETATIYRLRDGHSRGRSHDSAAHSKTRTCT